MFSQYPLVVQFTQRSIQNFKRIYLQEFGEELSDEKAKQKAGYLLEVYRSAYGLPSVEEFFRNKIADEEIKS